MKTARIALLATLVLADPASALARTTAHITRLTTFSARVAVAEKIAAAYWGSPACGGHFTATLADLPDSVAIGQATYATAPDGTFTSCSIQVARAFGSPKPPRKTLPWWAFCTTLVHEEGHLHDFHVAGGPDGGHHSADPRNVMYPGPTYVNTPPACFRYSF